MTATSQQRPRSKSFGDRVRELRERARQEAGLDSVSYTHLTLPTILLV